MSMIPEDLQGVLIDLADRLIPAGEGMPSAGAVLAPEDLERVLGELPGLLEPVLSALRSVAELAPEQRLPWLRSTDEPGLAAIGEAIAAAYFLVDAVADRIGYRRRHARPLRFEEDLAELTSPVIARGWRAPPPHRG